MAEIIAICNQKGGVGKTTTAINLAACLAGAEKRVLLVDFDPQGNATTGLGINKHDLETSVYNVIIGDKSVTDVSRETEMPFLKILPANTSLVGAEIELVSAVSRETRLKNKLENVKNDFDFIFIDCPPSLGLLTLNALAAAQSVIIPVQCEYFAMGGMADLRNTITLVREHINSELTIKGVVLTMYDKRNNLSKQVENELRSYLSDEIFDAVIPRNVRLSEAPSHGKPIILYDIASKGATSYVKLAEELLGVRCQKNVHKEAAGDEAFAANEMSDNIREQNEVENAGFPLSRE